MRFGERKLFCSAVAFLLLSGLGGLLPSRLHAQGLQSGAGSLGGFGGSVLEMGGSLGAGLTVLPYSGSYGGFMPYRMARGGDLGFENRSSGFMRESRSSLTPGPMTGVSGAAQSSGMGITSSRPMVGSAGPAMPSTSSFRGSGTAGMRSGVMPPDLGYPFRPPTRFLRQAQAGAGMSM